MIQLHISYSMVVYVHVYHNIIEEVLGHLSSTDTLSDIGEMCTVLADKFLLCKNEKTCSLQLSYSVCLLHIEIIF